MMPDVNSAHACVSYLLVCECVCVCAIVFLSSRELAGWLTTARGELQRAPLLAFCGCRFDLALIWIDLLGAFI